MATPADGLQERSMLLLQAYSYRNRGNRRVGIAHAPRSPLAARPVSAMPTLSALSYSVGTAPLRLSKSQGRRRAVPTLRSEFGLEHQTDLEYFNRIEIE